MLHRRSLALAVAAVLALSSCGADGDPTALEDPEPARSSGASVTSTTKATTSSTATTTTTTTTTTAPPTSTQVPPSTQAPVSLTKSAHASGPTELAARVVEAERLARDPGSSADVVAAASFELQQLYRQLGRNPGWDAEVLANVPDDLKLAVTANAAARREFRSMYSKLSDTLPPWRIVDPPPAEDLLRYYKEAESLFGVPWEILAAVNLVETGMGRIRGTSIAGAQGPMQFMPATWEAFGEGDVNNPRDAIHGAARYLAHNGGGRGEIDTALWNYNHSHRYVRGVKHYAAVIEQDPRAFHIFYNWQIVYLSTVGDVWLPTGFEAAERLPVTDYVAANPGHHLGRATN